MFDSRTSGISVIPTHKGAQKAEKSHVRCHVDAPCLVVASAICAKTGRLWVQYET